MVVVRVRCLTPGNALNSAAMLDRLRDERPADGPHDIIVARQGAHEFYIYVDPDLTVTVLCDWPYDETVEFVELIQCDD